jgi:EAL domain-containing protein (putative c-di-GMP-specific phosphodiesterase class I)
MTLKESAAQEAFPTAEYFADFASSYGEEVDRLVHPLIGDRVIVEIHEFVDTFYAHLSNRAESAAILARLSPEEFKHLKSKQVQHLCFLLAPGTTPQEHYQRALQVGRAHALVGVGLPMMMEAYHLYHRGIRQFQGLHGVGIPQRERLVAAFEQRLQLDLEAQITSYVRFDAAVASLLADLDEAFQEASNLADVLRHSLQTLGSFDGILACLFSRPDAQGVMQIEADGGQEGQTYAEALQKQRAPLFQIQGEAKAGSGPAGRAWRSGQIQINNSYEQEEMMHPWRAEARERGFRSSVAVPLLDESGQAFAILSLYSQWPGFFSAVTRKAMLQHIQHTMSHAVLRCERTTVVSAAQRRSYLQCLERGAVQMLYQPIVDLRTGKLDSLEALARLRGPGEQLIAPAAFLLTFGDAALLRLFQLGLDQICLDTRKWWEQDPHLNLPVGLNLPPNGLTQEAYRDSVFEALNRWELPASILKLEMLETKESLDVAKRDLRIAEFRQAGIRIEQDDLGSGYSSLLRMDQIPCDRVKIDQALVRSTVNRPVRALNFIYHLTLLAHDLGVQVTVEGLEDDGLIEASAILGVDHGQGYGIARPMGPRDVMPWSQAWSFQIDPERPRTALGALAGFLLWDRKLGMLTDSPDRAADFIKEPTLVHRYLDRTGKSASNLSMILERTQIVALQGQKSLKYTQIRQELIEQLSVTWSKERS